MRRFVILFILLLVAVAGSISLAARVPAQAGTVTLVSVQNEASEPRYTYRWTTDASGNVTENAVTVKPGYLVQVMVIPDSGGTQPTDLFDMTILDESGLDVASGQLANLSNAAATLKSWDPRIYNQDKLDIRVANGGNAKSGQIVLLISKGR